MRLFTGWILSAGLVVAAVICWVPVAVLAGLALTSVLASATVASGQPPFTDFQKADLKERHPGGDFVNKYTYRYCDHNDLITYVDSDRQVWTDRPAKTCAGWLSPRSP